MPGFDAVIKAVGTILRGIGVDVCLFRMKTLDQDAIGLFGLVDQRHRLVEEAAGLQRGDIDRQLVLADDGRDHLIFDTERRGKDGTAFKAGNERETSCEIQDFKRLVQSFRGGVEG